MKSHVDRFESYLKSRGLDLTPNMQMVLDIVFREHRHFTLDELQEETRGRLKKEEVHDALHEMINAGLIRSVVLDDGRVQYEHVYGHAHHDHLICVECGTIVEFQDEKIEQLQRSIAEAHGFSMLGHALQIKGLCEKCRGKEPGYRPEFVHHPHDGDTHERMPLTMVSSGESVEVIQIHGGMAIRNRLAAMGLMEGDRVEVLANEFAGPVILRSRGTRLAIGQGMAHHILVRQAAGSESKGADRGTRA